MERYQVILSNQLSFRFFFIIISTEWVSVYLFDSHMLRDVLLMDYFKLYVKKKTKLPNWYWFSYWKKPQNLEDLEESFINKNKHNFYYFQAIVIIILISNICNYHNLEKFSDIISVNPVYMLKPNEIRSWRKKQNILKRNEIKS